MLSRKLFVGLVVVVGVIASAAAQDKTPSTKPGSTFRDCSDCPVMVVIPPGSFTMGETPEEQTFWHEEPAILGTTNPPHKVTIKKPFALGQFEITRTEFAAFVKETHYTQLSDVCLRLVPNNAVEVPRGGHFQPDASSIHMSGLGWRNPGFTQTDTDPVICVNWVDAENYAMWLSKKTGQHYFLPSEAQWEYAGRAGTTTPFWWGDKPEDACKYENVGDESFAKAFLIRMTPFLFHCNDGFSHTSPVGSFKPNPWGLYDMLGNAWEWTEDCHHDNYIGAPTDETPWMTGGDCAHHEIRTPGWEHDSRSQRVAIHFGEPTDSLANAGGFRIARALP